MGTKIIYSVGRSSNDPTIDNHLNTARTLFVGLNLQRFLTELHINRHFQYFRENSQDLSSVSMWWVKRTKDVPWWTLRKSF